jgi:hypothetical protein
VVTKKASGTRCTGDARGHGAKHGKAARMLQLRDPSIAPLYLLRYSTADPLNSLSTFRANPPSSKSDTTANRP